MADPRDPRETGGSYLAGAVSGGVLGVVVGAFLVSVIGYPFLKKKLAHSSLEDRYPLVVASQDISAGTVVTFDLITQHSVPEECVTPSAVKVDSASKIVDQRINTSVRTGDILLWNQFETTKQPLGLVAAHDIPVGEALTEGDLEGLELPPAFTTPSFVRQSELPQIVGRTVTTAFRKGDPILWTHLQNEPPPAKSAKDKSP